MVVDFHMVKSKSNSVERDSLEDQTTRAEDIILGALGFGEEAQIISITRTASGFKGGGRWLDGEEFSFENEDELNSLEEWAVTVLLKNRDTTLT